MEQSIVKKPGEMALVAIKNQNQRAVQVFKKPTLPLAKKDKKIILSEESYMKVYKLLFNTIISIC